MELKRILARDSRSANEKAIQLYGKEAMIISSQRVDDQIELVIAVDTDESSEPIANPAAEVPKPEAANPTARSFGKCFEDAQLQPLPEWEAAPAPAVAAVSAPALERATTLAASAMSEAASGYEMKRSQEIVTLLREEIATLREDLMLTMRSRLLVAGSPLSPDVHQLMQNLREAGMPASMQLLLESGLEQVSTMQEGLDLIAKTLLKTMKRKSAKAPTSGWHAVVGPTGSGKTCMAARLAHAAALEHGADKQALISFNDARPGAWAQMQVLASQAGVDCYRAQDLASLQAVLDDLGPHRSIWIDTAGVHFMTAAQTLGALGLRVHAVLPVDATMTHVQKTLQNDAHAWSSCFLTKADEATPSWAMIKGLCDISMPVSGVSGQAGIQTALLPYDPHQLIEGALVAAGVQQMGASLDMPKANPARRSPGTGKAAPRKKSGQAQTKSLHG